MTATLEDPLRSARRAVQAGQFREAWQSLEQQPATVRRSAEWQLLAAMARWRLGEFAASRSAALQARDAYRGIGDVDGEMRAENMVGAGAFALGELDEAQRGFARALELAERLSDELMLARTANNIGIIAYYLGRHSSALSYYRVAQSRFERTGFDYGVAETLINIGIVWRDLGNLHESQAAAERALEIAEQHGWRLAAQALAMRGEALGLLGDIPLGRAQIDRALSFARLREDREAEIESLRILSNLERKAGRLTLAEDLGRKALDLALTLDSPMSIAEVQRDLAEVLIASGRKAEARRCWIAAADRYEKLGALSRAGVLREKAT
jgi:tetratricopeptide (TPR) repeat protein